MSCPTQFHGVHLSIPDTFSGADFFSDNTVDHWQLEDYLDWKLPTGCNKKPDAYFLQSQYLLDLNNLKQSGCLPREVSRYVGNLIKENKRPAEQFSTWWNEVKKHSGKKIINNIIKENTISGDFNVNTAETMTVHSEKQQQPQQQSQPQQEELLFEEASPSVSATKRPPEDKVGASGKKSKTAKAR
ncbi:hypothetical protein BCR42DRAFT_152555 [Absidia repens]|uniref:Uncharacterized protein n=1 Tax=Absidia repens TaxID=90262 RepID=A0A1X2I1F4_9FUNG|nr:hypothetical protein BCR42DRAFT_152555 [Absidia repens]